MYTFMNVVCSLAAIVFLMVVAVWAYNQWQKDAPRREHLAKKNQLSADGVYYSAEHEDVREMARQSLSTMGIPSVDADQMILNVPSLHPQQDEKWAKDQQVITSSRAKVFMSSGLATMDLLELSDGYLLLHKGNKVMLLNRYNLTTAEESDLEQQRRDMIKKRDGIIEDFLGHVWEIKGALGDAQDGSGGKSKIQVLSKSSKLGEVGLRSTLPSDVLDGAEHTYYDLQAICKETDQALYFFYTAGSWSCYIGRVLTETEVNGMQGL